MKERNGKLINIWKAFGLSLYITLNILVANISAMPPHPDAVIKSQTKNNNLIGLSARKMYAVGLNAPSKLLNINKESVNGTFKALAILIEFSDRPSQVDAADFDTLLFIDQQSSLRHYYNEMSYGQLDIISVNLPSAVGWITAPSSYTYYCNGQNGTGPYPQNSQGLCEDIVDLVDPIVDFSQYDNNADGFVDALILIHTGPGAELFGPDSTDLIWSHKWSITPRTRDGVKIYEYTIQPEYWHAPGDITCGVFCHEMGHIFGLPDLYDRDNSSNGIGRWSLMAYGSWLGPSGLGSVPAGLDAWSRIKIGFNNYTNVTSNSSGINIPNIESGGPIYRLWSSGSIGSEYFLIENRQKIGYDAYLPSSGLLIWHIDETQTASYNDDEWYPGFTSSGNYLIALEQSDGFFELEKKISKGDSGDPYPGILINSDFSPSTLPGSDSYLGDNTYVAVNNISASAAIMTADFQVSLLSDVLETDQSNYANSFSLGQNYPNPFNPATTIDINLLYPSEISLVVYDILGREVETLFNGKLPAGDHRINWNSLENDNNRFSSGIYFYKLITEYGTETRKMTLIK